MKKDYIDFVPGGVVAVILAIDQKQINSFSDSTMKGVAVKTLKLKCVSYKNILLGVRSTGESTQAMVGIRF